MVDKKFRVLIVEDAEYIRKGLRITTDWIGHKCIVVGDAGCGTDAVKMFKKLKPDIIISDIRMPDMTGLEMLEKLKSENQNFVSIIISAYDDFSYAKKAIELGAVAYILKPIDSQELYSALDKATELIRNMNLNANARVVMDNKDKYDSLIGILDTISNYARDEKYLKQAIEIISNNYTDNLSIDSVAEMMNISGSYLLKLFKSKTNYSFLDVLTVYRLKMAIKLMDETDFKVYEIAEKVGYKDPRYFSDVFKKYFGVSPSKTWEVIRKD